MKVFKYPIFPPADSISSSVRFFHTRIFSGTWNFHARKITFSQVHRHARASRRELPGAGKNLRTPETSVATKGVFGGRMRPAVSSFEIFLRMHFCECINVGGYVSNIPASDTALVESARILDRWVCFLRAYIRVSSNTPRLCVRTHVVMQKSSRAIRL